MNITRSESVHSSLDIKKSTMAILVKPNHKNRLKILPDIIHAISYNE